MHELTCEQVHDAAAGYALDIIEANERAGVSAHLVRCPLCRNEVNALQESADRLLAGTGDAGGPDGASEEGRSRRPRRFRLVATMAAAALLMVGSTFGAGITHSAVRSRPVLATRELVQGTRSVGRVNVYADEQLTMDLSVEGVSAKGRVTCEAVSVSGAATPLGSFQLFHGSGYWGTSRPVDLGQLAGIALVDGAGRLVASAAFT